MNAKDIVEKIIGFMNSAGELAIEKQSGIDFFASKLKSDKIMDVVTETDFAISKMFKEFVEREFSDLDPLIVDEESVSELGENPIEKVKAAKYSFIIDPIDGTLTYSTGYPLWGISIGVFREGKPYVGAVYAPAIKTLMYADDKEATLVERAFTTDERVKKLERLGDDVESAPFIVTDPAKVTPNDKWNPKELSTVNLYASVMRTLYVAIGRARCGFSTAYIWDLAGSLPVFDKVGVVVQNFTTGRPLDLDAFNGKLKLESLYIMCRPKYFDYMKNIIDKR